jgi:tricorn protease
VKPLPMPVAGSGDFAPDGRKVFYSPLFRDFRRWKRYQGGWAQDLYVFDLASRALEAVAVSPRTERDPMGIGAKLYFSSDRNGTLNLYEYDPAGKKTRALTQSTQWDERWPGKGDQGRIVYETDGELHVVDVKSGASKRIRIDVPSDQLASRPSQMNAGGQIAEYDLSPKGERAIFVARGDGATAPIEKGAPHNLTEDRFLGQGRPAVGADRGRPFAGAGGRRGARPDVRLSLVARQCVGRLQPDREERGAVDLDLERGRKKGAPGDAVALQRNEPGVGSGRAVPVLPQRPRVRAVDRAGRV